MEQLQMLKNIDSQFTIPYNFAASYPIQFLFMHKLTNSVWAYLESICITQYSAHEKGNID